MFGQLFGCEHEHATTAACKFQPDKRHAGISIHQGELGVTYFHHQHAIGGQIRFRFGQNAPRDVQAVISCAQTQCRFAPILHRQRIHFRMTDIGRIGDDQIVTLLRQTAEHIRLHGAHSALHLMALNIHARNLEGIRRNVHSIYLRLGKCQRTGDCNAT